MRKTLLNWLHSCGVVGRVGLARWVPVAGTKDSPPLRESSLAPKERHSPGGAAQNRRPDKVNIPYTRSKIRTRAGRAQNLFCVVVSSHALIPSASQTRLLARRAAGRVLVPGLYVSSLESRPRLGNS